MSAGLLLLAATVLGWRRFAGALSSPLEPTGLAMVGVTVAAAAVAVRVAWRYRSGRRPSARLERLLAASVSAAVLGMGAALSLPGAAPSGLAVLWSVLAAEECWAWGPRAWRRLRAGRRASAPVERETNVGSPTVSAAHPNLSAPVRDEPPDDEVTQKLTRSQAADGSEVLSGWLRVAMAAGQRSANVHLAFCPPFPRIPRVTVEQLEGPQVRIKTVQRLPYGARFDLKLASPSEGAATVLLRFSAEAGAPAEASTDRAAP